MIINKYVTEYIEQYKNGEIKLNKERIQFIEHLEKYVFVRDDLYFDEDLIDKCIRFTEKWFFKLLPFQKFIIAFIFLFKDDGVRFYRKFFLMLARGNGKNGLVSALVTFLTSELHGIKNYNVAIVANSEKQSMVSFNEIYDTIEDNPPLKRAFENKKSIIRSRKTNSTIEFLSSNASTKDSRRDAINLFDEIHQYEDDSVVRVMNSGLGKVKNSRQFYITTQGHVRMGFLDEMLESANDVLNGTVNETNNMFIFICKLDDAEQIHDKSNWQLANPMFCKPMSDYAKTLYETVLNEYNDLPKGRLEFMTKRMNLPEVDPEKDVASREQLLATNQPYPDLKGKTCIASFDYASIRDFASAGCLFKVNGKYYWITHTWVRKELLEQVKIKAPIKKWELDGLLTIVDEPTIDPQHLIDWFNDKREIYGIHKVVADGFRMDLLKPLLEENGYDYEFIRNPSGVHSKIAPIVETAFGNNNVVYGDNPLMRWFTNNTLVKTDARGNKTYMKKEEKARKTDGFQAFLMALYKMDEIEEIDIGATFDFLNSLF